MTSRRPGTCGGTRAIWGWARRFGCARARPSGSDPAGGSALPTSPTSHKMRPVSAFAKVGIVALLLGAIGAVGAVVWLPDWVPPQAGVEAGRQDTLYAWLLVMSAIIFSVVVSFLVYSMWKFRARPGDMSDGAPIH